MSSELLSKLESTVLPWVGKTGKMLHLFMADKLKQHGFNMTMEQAIILKILKDNDGRAQNDMAIVTNRHKATLTRLLDTMEKNHLVVRITDQNDKRMKRVYLTKHGKSRLVEMMPAFEEAANEVQKELTKNEIKTLIKLLKKVQGNIHFSESEK